MNDIKKLLDDKVKFSYAVSFLFLGILAFVLLVKHDIGGSFKLDQRLTDTHNNLRRLEKTADYIDYLNQFDSKFTENKGSNKLMEILSTTAKEKGVTLGILKPLETKTVSGYKMTRVAAEGSGTYPDIVDLIKTLENYEKYIFVEHMAINAGENRQGNMGQSIAGPSRTIGSSSKHASGGEAAANTSISKFTLNIALLNPVK